MKKRRAKAKLKRNARGRNVVRHRGGRPVAEKKSRVWSGVSVYIAKTR